MRPRRRIRSFRTTFWWPFPTRRIPRRVGKALRFRAILPGRLGPTSRCLASIRTVFLSRQHVLCRNTQLLLGRDHRHSKIGPSASGSDRGECDSVREHQCERHRVLSASSRRVSVSRFGTDAFRGHQFRLLQLSENYFDRSAYIESVVEFCRSSCRHYSRA